MVVIQIYFFREKTAYEMRISDWSSGVCSSDLHIRDVQAVFGDIFNAGPEFRRDGSDFDRLWSDGDRFAIGELPVTVLHVPGHTPACVAYLIGDVVFVGATMFLPDYGSARADFPCGYAVFLFRSLRRILALPGPTPLFMCHPSLTPPPHAPPSPT